MDTLGRNDSLERGTKRKYAGDWPEMRGPAKAATGFAEDTAASLRTESSITNFASELIASRGDDYYRALYAEALDFRLLGQRDPEFKAVLGRGSYLDFADPRSVMQLTKTLLKLDFGLLVDLPTDRLCPPVPNRHNYILWLKDLLDSSSPLRADSRGTARGVTGLDIGTGASLIYPLLGCAQRPSWSFVATDVDAKSLAYARKNAALNNLQSRIRVVGRATTDRLIPLDELGLAAVDFVMVNPPFYTSAAELDDLARQKSRPPNSACTGAPVEMVCAGGEIGFVRRMILESLVLSERVQWYTAMLGKQSSLEVLVSVLRDHGVANYAVTAFVQGSKTRRWALGWSFGNSRPSLSACRGCEPAAGKKLLPPPTEAAVATWTASRVDVAQLERSICDAMESLDLASWTWDKSLYRGVGFVDSNVWGRAYRRKKARERERGGACFQSEETVGDGSSYPQQEEAERRVCQDTSQCSFGFSVSVRNDADEVAVMARWLQGNDYAIFESFTGFLRKSIGLN